jgi:hypothetical protein
MEKNEPNIGRLVFNLVPGWFVAAFLQTVAISLFTGAWADVWGRFTAIALFRNGTGVLVNILIIVAITAITVPLWILLRGRRASSFPGAR